MKTCAFRTLGCKVNQYETQVIRESFVNAGYREVRFGEVSDIYVINTCTVTAKTDRESRRLIRQAIGLNPGGRVIVTGCYTELDEGRIREIPGVHLIVKNRDKDRIVEIFESGRAAPDRRAADYAPMSVSGFKGMTKSYIKVQDGCDNFCSYCKIPLARGRSRSRDMASTVEEARRLVANGFREIILTGICLGAWGEDLRPRTRLSALLERLAALDGDFRVRLSSIEPKYVDDGLIGAMRSSPKICRHLHLPLQSGDDKVLWMMNRPYTAGEYRETVEAVRKAIPDVSITTDVLVGFPQEAESNFNNTYELLKEIAPSRVHPFPYSKREGTVAASMGDELPKNVVKRRMEKIKSLARLTSLQYRKSFLNKTTGVLVETERERGAGLLKGYDDKYIKVIFEGPDSYMSSITPVRIERVEDDLTLGLAV